MDPAMEEVLATILQGQRTLQGALLELCRQASADSSDEDQEEVVEKLTQGAEGLKVMLTAMNEGMQREAGYQPHGAANTVQAWEALPKMARTNERVFLGEFIDEDDDDDVVDYVDYEGEVNDYDDENADEIDDVDENDDVHENHVGDEAAVDNAADDCENDHDESEEEVPPRKQAAPANATPAAPAKEAGMVKAKEESGEDDFDSQEECAGSTGCKLEGLPHFLLCFNTFVCDLKY